MPLATEEEWAHRHAKRELEIEKVKQTPYYELYVSVVPREQRAEDDPLTPDPLDRSTSKRTWKWRVEEWRLKLKASWPAEEPTE